MIYSLLFGAAGSLAAYFSYSHIAATLTPILSDMQRLGWWQVVKGKSPFHFTLRCEFNTACRDMLNSNFLADAGYSVVIFPVSLLAATISFAILAYQIKKGGAVYFSKFAALSDVRKLIVRPSNPYTIPLIRMGRVLLGVQFRPSPIGWFRRQLTHILVEAPTQSGKSVMAVQIIQTFLGSLIAVDIKGELYRMTAGFRSLVGPVHVLDPRGRGSRFDPFAELGTDELSMDAAARLLIIDPREKEQIFAERALPAVKSALRAAHLSGVPPLSYLNDLCAGGATYFIQTLAGIRNDYVRRNLIGFLGVAPEEFKYESLTEHKSFIGSSFMTMRTRLEPFFLPGVLDMMSGSDFTATDLRDGTSTLYLSWPEELLDSVSRPLAFILHSLITSMMRKSDQKPSTLPTLMLLDEAAQYRIPALKQYITTMLGRNIAYLLFIQDKQQLRDLYGDAAKVIISNCKAKVTIAPDDDAAEELSRRLGHVSVQVENHHSGTKGTSRNHYRRELMTPDELNWKLGPREGILRVRGFRPVRGKRLLWFRHLPSKRRGRIPPPPVPGATLSPKV